jgi:hypothetical protein
VSGVGQKLFLEHSFVLAVGEVVNSRVSLTAFGVIVGIGLPALVAFVWGPRQSVGRFDLVYGTAAGQKKWLGYVVSDTVVESDVSRWAKANGIAGLAPRWVVLNTEYKSWFGPTTVGDGAWPDVVVRIYSAPTLSEGQKRELLRAYQKEISECTSEGTLLAVAGKWAEQVGSRSTP